MGFRGVVVPDSKVQKLANKVQIIDLHTSVGNDDGSNVVVAEAWKPHSEEVYKVNVDATLSVDCRVGSCIVVWDCN